MNPTSPCCHPTDPALALLPITGSDRPAVIDAYALAATSGMAWRLVGAGYVATTLSGATVYLSAVIAGTVPDHEVHHEDGDKLNNTADNLQHLTPEEHRHAHRVQRGPRPGHQYRGITRCRRSGKWLAQLRLNRRLIRNGCSHETPEAAALAWNELSRQYLGPDAYLNLVN